MRSHGDPIPTLAALSAMFLCFVGTGTATAQRSGAAEPERTDSISLERAAVFSAADGSAIRVPADRYRLEAAGRGALRLSSKSPTALEVAAAETKHGERLDSPLAFAANTGADQLHLVLMLPDGRVLDAVGSYSGIGTRGTISASLSNAQLSTLKYSRQYTLQQPTRVVRVIPAPSPAGPDLQISVERLSFSNVFNTVKWGVTVKNHGTGDAFFDTAGGAQPVIFGQGDDDYVAPGPRITTNTFLQPGQSLSFEVYQYYSCPRAGETPHVRFKADLYDAIPELNEANNEWRGVEQPFVTSGQPDLVVSSISFEPASPTKYDAVKIFVEMRNAGNGAAILCNGEATWRATQKPAGAWQHVGHSTSQKVDPGVTFRTTNYGNSFAQAGMLQPGSYPVTVAVDPDELIAESNESNNASTVTLTVRQ